MPVPTTIGREVVGFVGPVTSMLASTKNLIVLDANMANWLEHDWSIAGVSAPGVSAGGPVFPAGALLGFQPAAVDLHMRAYPADDAVAAYVASAAEPVYTWTSVLIANRGQVGAANIPASNNAMAVVLAKDVDITSYTTGGQRPIVPIIWQGTFQPRGILQDQESYLLGKFPTVLGACDRLQIVPKPGWKHG